MHLSYQFLCRRLLIVKLVSQKRKFHIFYARDNNIRKNAIIFHFQKLTSLKIGRGNGSVLGFNHIH